MKIRKWLYLEEIRHVLVAVLASAADDRGVLAERGGGGRDGRERGAAAALNDVELVSADVGATRVGRDERAVCKGGWRAGAAGQRDRSDDPMTSASVDGLGAKKHALEGAARAGLCVCVVVTAVVVGRCACVGFCGVYDSHS